MQELLFPQACRSRERSRRICGEVSPRPRAPFEVRQKFLGVSLSCTGQGEEGFCTAHDVDGFGEQGPSIGEELT
jgi:hypothetical protein